LTILGWLIGVATIAICTIIGTLPVYARLVHNSSEAVAKYQSLRNNT
jgi:hypothetical protein